MRISRRNLIRASSAGVLAVAAPSALAGARKPGPSGMDKALLAVDERARSAYIRRVTAAGKHLLGAVNLPPQPLNSDETTVPDFAGSFSKCLAHNAIGEVDPDAYRKLVAAVETSDHSGVPLAIGAERKLANPSATNAFDIHGRDAHTTRIAASPGLRSALAAAEMVEVYWQALTRDVPFADYARSPLVADALADLNALSTPVGPREGGSVTAGTLFRGSTAGDLDGPYISQFLYLPVAYGAGLIDQRYRQPVQGNDFMVDFDSYLAIQHGRRPTAADQFEADARYIQTSRDLANYVHRDVLFQAYYNAAIILLGFGSDALADENPLRSDPVEGGFVTFGGPDMLNMIATAARMSLTGAWFQKWRHRKLRPEAFGARVEVQLKGLADYGLHPEVMGSEAVARTVSLGGSALLPQAYPEGSPTHPSYPAGHATVAGACVTIMKACFREDFVIPNVVAPSADGLRLVPYDGQALTVGGELNKLANNISIGRNAAGVHYRSDGEEGMLAGEQQAIGLLQDYTLCHHTPFDGFRVTRFDGTRVLVREGEVMTV